MTDAWQEMDDWCAKRYAKVADLVNSHVLNGGALDGPDLLLNFGELRGLLAMRSFIHGARQAQDESAFRPTPSQSGKVLSELACLSVKERYRARARLMREQQGLPPHPALRSRA